MGGGLGSWEVRVGLVAPLTARPAPPRSIPALTRLDDFGWKGKAGKKRQDGVTLEGTLGPLVGRQGQEVRKLSDWLKGP